MLCEFCFVFLSKHYTSSGGRFTVTEHIKIDAVGPLAAGADGCL